ncbi:hypothetical protein ACIGO9_15865 [Nocardia asteroides]|uniref:hypothetical protein n=1 Tax=Nocardia asteroides TaxID=1824 RepID=UPI0037CC3140
MANFPNGNFTITNNNTGRCLRVRLGATATSADHKEGTSYFTHVTTKPWLELGPDDGSIATAWYFHTGYDTVERKDFNQIVSVAVRDLQNIGNHCVWMNAGDLTWNDGDPDDSEAYWAARDARTEDRKKYLEEFLAARLPKEWPTSQATLDNWENKYWASYVFRKGQGDVPYFWRTEVDDRFHDAGLGRYTGSKGAVIDTIDAYAREAAQDGVYQSSPWSIGDATTRLYGCGASRGSSTTYRWATNGLNIYAADDDTVDSDTTFWTDVDGQLVSRPAGSSGQSWALKAWTPPPPAPTDGEAVVRTGMFGPIGAALGL